MNLSRRDWLTLTGCGLLGAAARAQAPGGEPPPNILHIVADDLGWADVGWHGSVHRTPHLDALVRGGVELDQHYVQPVCTPTRTALMTGRWTSRFGPHVQQPSNLRALPPGTETIASALRRAGYTTCLSGKWHLGSRAEWGPNHYGFDHSYGSLAGAADPWTHQYRPGPYAKTWHRDEKTLDEEGNATELVAAQAVRWIREMRAPWYVYVPFQAVHIPVDAPEEYKRPYADHKFSDDPATDDGSRRFAAFCSQMDAKVGEMVKALEETGQRERTLIVFHSDNGGLHGGGNAYISTVKGTPKLSSNLPLRGQKAQLYEGGVRVCALANWPGRLAPRKCAQVMHAADWMPTLTRLAGWRPTTDPKWDGRDVWPQVSGAAELVERTVYIPLGANAALRQGDWKLISFNRDARQELYNLADDPYEKQDRAAAEPERVQAMMAHLMALRRDDLAELPADLKGLPG